MEVAEILASGIAGLARAYGWRATGDRPITALNCWASLARRDFALPHAVRRLLRDHVLVGDAPWEEGAWQAFLAALLPFFGDAPQAEVNDIVAFCTFVAEHKADLADPERRSTKQVCIDDVTLRLGSIHSVKGKTVDGILVVETEVWKGSAAADQCYDLSTVLPNAFGIANKPFTGAQLTAATNVFVGVTRPRELLGLALRRAMAANLIAPAERQGWKVVNLAG